MAKKQKTTKPAGKVRKSSKGAAAPPAGTPRTRARDPRLPAPGTTITRTLKGKEIRLEVLDDGFRMDGKHYRSLTAAALVATGYPAVSGWRFFKLDAASTTPKRVARKAKGVASDVVAHPAAVAETATA